MNKKILLTIFAAVLCSLAVGDLPHSLFAPHSAQAVIQLDEGMRPSNLPSFDVAEEATEEDNPETRATQTVVLFVGNLVSQFLLFAGAITIIFLIVAGANYIFAFGKDQLIEKGKKGIVWSLLGLVIIMLSYALVQGVIQIVLQVDEKAN